MLLRVFALMRRISAASELVRYSHITALDLHVRRTEIRKIGRAPIRFRPAPIPKLEGTVTPSLEIVKFHNLDHNATNSEFDHQAQTQKADPSGLL